MGNDFWPVLSIVLLPALLVGTQSSSPSAEEDNPLLQPSCTPAYSWPFWLSLMAPIELAITPQVRLLGCSPASHPDCAYNPAPGANPSTCCC